MLVIGAVIKSCAKKKLLHRYFSIFLTIDGSQNRTFILVEHISMATSLELQRKMDYFFPFLLTYLITYLLNYFLTHFIRAPTWTILGKFAGLKYYKRLSSSSLCCTAWDKWSCHDCGMSIVQSKIKQFHYTRSEGCL